VKSLDLRSNEENPGAMYLIVNILSSYFTIRKKNTKKNQNNKKSSEISDLILIYV
jgi:hypothetical protein